MSSERDESEKWVIDPIIRLPEPAMKRLLEILNSPPKEPSPALKALFQKQRARSESNRKPTD